MPGLWTLNVGLIAHYPVDNCPKLVLRSVSWSSTPLPATARPTRLLEASVAAAAILLIDGSQGSQVCPAEMSVGAAW